MAKNLKLNIKNTQIAQAINLSGLKSKLAKKKEEEDVAIKPSPSDLISKEPKLEEELIKEEAPRIKARSKSVFSEPSSDKPPQYQNEPEPDLEIKGSSQPLEVSKSIFSDESEEEPKRVKTSAELRQDIFGTQHPETVSPIKEALPQYIEKASQKQPIQMSPPLQPLPKANLEVPVAKPPSVEAEIKPTQPPKEMPADKLGPTGRHIKDYYQPKAITPAPRIAPTKPPVLKETADANQFKSRTKPKGADEVPVKPTTEDKVAKPSKFKEFRDVKPTKKTEVTKQFDARDRQGLRSTEEDQQWRKRRNKTGRMHYQEDTTIRPTTLKVRVPISIKDLASEMKLKASQLISKLFLQGMVVTLNDVLEDETTIQLLGHEFNCEIAIDSTNEKRIRITDFSIKEELSQTPADQLILRPPVVAFMGHVDHGKTSLIDSIRKSHVASGEAGAITQHIGAFRCQTPVGDIAILDTPGHEAFSAMRARGADVTDIVVLVVAGDEGIREQTIEAIQHAQAAGVIMVVAINKCDKPNFNAENVYRQLSEKNLLPEAWGGELLTVNCSATTGEGIPELLEMLALQAEILELRANPNFRARGTVLESEMHKGMGAVATILVQNGTLRKGDALVFSQHWGRVKTMHDEFSRELQEAGPSTPVEITGLSGLPEAGQEFIVVKTEKEAREIAGARSEGLRQSNLVLQQKKKTTIEHLFQTTSPITQKKILNLVLRADVQGSLEALKAAILKIESDKAEPNIIFCGIGEVSESDVQLAAASKAVILGFHTQIENHAEPIVKQLGIKVRLHDIIYHAVDDIRVLMSGLLEKIPQEIEKGKAVVKATFKSSHTGIIAGCQVSEGTIHRNHLVRVRRGQNVVWKGMISSLKRLKEDVREVQKGLECGIFLTNFADIQENDVIEAYEMIYITQEL